MNLKTDMALLGVQARSASHILRLASTAEKSSALRAMAAHVRERRDDILSASQKDCANAEAKDLSAAMIDRLKLDAPRVEAIAKSLEDIAGMTDPVGTVDKNWTQPNGLNFTKIRVPIGVIGMIYESRPNVTADAGALCLKSGNACILRGGSESVQSNKAIHTALVQGLKDGGLPETAIQLIPTIDRTAVGLLLQGLDGCVDLIIPRGGKSLIERVQNDARVPVLAHLEGLCHSYVDGGADMAKALSIIENAKLRRTGVCGATETLLVDAAIATTFLPQIYSQLSAQGCELRGDMQTCKILPNITPANSDDFSTEHLAAIINVAIVDGINGALSHITQYSSGHTDAIITEDEQTAQRFLADVDSAIVIHNASTQFADGGEFGFGAEIGIATGRLHARGPVGAEQLTSYKYQLRGNGQIRPK
ncbi:MAG: glutamate-5-semialdehyde dehydrogenase [Litorimonas sp.]